MHWHLKVNVVHQSGEQIVDFWIGATTTTSAQVFGFPGLQRASLFPQVVGNDLRKKVFDRPSRWFTAPIGLTGEGLIFTQHTAVVQNFLNVGCVPRSRTE